MIIKEVIIQEEYTSEDGRIYWVKGKIRNSVGVLDVVGLGGEESLKSAMRVANNFMKKFSIKDLDRWKRMV
jgi:hypothetical protein